MTEPQATTPPPPQAVYIKDADGAIMEGPASGLDAALKAGGQQITPDEAEQAQSAEKYSGAGHTLAAGAINFADMTALGFGKGLAAAIGGKDTAEYIKGVTEAHPFAANVGTGLGVVAPLLLSGGSSALAEGGGALGLAGRALAAPTEALGAFGGLGEAGAKALVGDAAESMLGRAAQGGIRTGVRGMLEGGLLGAGQTFSDAEIENHPLTAELLLAGMKKGALYGGALGTGLGVAGGVLGKGAEALANRFGGDADLVGELGLRSAGARLPEVKQLTAKGTEPMAIGRAIVDELPKYSDKPFMRMTKEDMRDAAKAWVKEAGERVGAGIDDLSTIAQEKGVRPDVNIIANRVDREIIAPMRKLPGYESEVAQLEKYTHSFVSKGQDATFADLNTFRKALDQKIFKGGRAPTENSVLDQLWDVRRIIEDEAENQGKAVAGKEWLDRYQGTKKYFGTAKEAERVATKGAERELGRNMVGISDMIAAGAGFAHAGPVGILAGAAHHIAKEYGTQFAADMLNRAQQLHGLKTLAAKSSGLLDSGMERFLTEARQKTQTAATKATVARASDSFKTASERIQSVASTPEALQAHIAPTTPDAAVAPRLGATMAAKHAAALSWLNAQVPAGLAPSPLVPTVTGKPPRVKMDAWMLKHDVYKDPIGVTLKALQRGTLTKDHVDALKAMYPEIHKELQQKALGRLAELGAKGKTPEFRKLNRLGLLLGIPASAAQASSFVQSQQMLYAKHDSAASQSAGSPPSAPRNQRGARTSLASGEDSLDERAS